MPWNYCGPHDAFCDFCQVHRCVHSRVSTRLESGRTSAIEPLQTELEWGQGGHYSDYKFYLEYHLQRNGTADEQRLFRELCINCSNTRFIHEFELPPIIATEFPRGKEFRLDIYCPDLWLAVEVDGSSHFNRNKEDMQRDRLVLGIGIKTMRFTVDEIRRGITSVVDAIKTELSARAAAGICFDKNPAEEGRSLKLRGRLDER